MKEPIYYINEDQTIVFVLMHNNTIIEICKYSTKIGTYSRINQYKATDFDIEFIKLTNRQVESPDAFEVVDELFSFYQELFKNCNHPHPPDAQN